MTKRQREYVIIGQEKETGEYVGYTENSFSMGITKSHVRVWQNRSKSWSGKISLRDRGMWFSRTIVETTKDLNAVKNTPYTWRFYRARSKDCPVRIKHHSNNQGKYDWRNKKFKSKAA